ncbi:MAG: DUF1800 domain-containing protein [Acidobacteria bacterium]|nr:MAG: DUF1800 domain-containing protein [Acidobacteriota bacterium]
MRYFRYLARVCVLICLAGLQAARAQPVPDWQIIHVLNRLAFGPSLEDVRRVRAMGVDRYIAEQLAPESIEEPFELGWRLAALETLKYNAVQLRQLYGPLPSIRGFKLPSEFAKARSERARAVAREAAQARILRAVLSRRQLEEVMVDFWFNHFNVFAGKELDDLWIGDYEQRAIRPFVLGRFRDLLFAVTKHPAMLVYLDNTLSTAPGSPGGRNSRVGLNENFAREVMELHTLGVDGGYTQKDVTEVARCFTGWTMRNPRQGEPSFFFNDRIHDHGDKVVLGHRIVAKGGGKNEGDEVIHILATHPSTARFVSYKLARRFVSDEPPKALVDRAAETFRKSGGDIRAVVKTIVTSPEFLSPATRSAKVKTPFEFVVSAVRATGADVGDARALTQRIAAMGMPLYQQQPPTGYKDTAEAWVSTSGLLARLNLALDLAAGRVRGVSVDASRLVPASAASDPDAVAAQLVPSGLAESTRKTLESEAAAADPARVAGLILGSPEFQRR